MWIGARNSRQSEMSIAIASTSARGGRDASQVAYARGSAADRDRLQRRRPLRVREQRQLPPREDRQRQPQVRLARRASNSSTPDGDRKHLKPRTPASASGVELRRRCRARRRPRTSTSTRRVARRVPLRLERPQRRRRRHAVERHVDDRRDAAGRGRGASPSSKPSHSVRPGSLTWTCVSTRPGMTTRSPTSRMPADRRWRPMADGDR